MNKRFFIFDKLSKSFQNRYQTQYQTQQRIRSMQCTVLLTADTLTALVGLPISLMAKVDPPAVYNVNFKDGTTLLNSTPITTNLDGTVSFSWNTTGQSAGFHNITVESVSPICTSPILTVALTTISTQCTGITINNPSPITAYIGDIISASSTATVTEDSVIEFRDVDSGMLIGSCTITPTTNSCTTNIDTTGATPGTYHVVAAIGYGPAQQCISSPVDAILQEIPGKIVVLSIPPGARIYLDNIDKGINSSAIISNVIPNISHDIKLTLSGYQDFSDTITVSPGETGIISAVLIPTIPPTGVGNLNVTSVPNGVEFGLYTGETGTAPTIISGVPAGINAYEAGLTGYNGAMGSFIIKSGETTNLNIPLQLSTPDMGMVGIESIPMGANIYIDGSPIGAKTSFMTLMSPGTHTYELRLSGYQSKSGSFTVVTGTDMPAIVSETLQPLQPSGAGAGAAAAIILGGAAVGLMVTAKGPK